jgi:hypothetical protein
LEALQQRVMSVALGEPIDDGFIELVYDQCGFRSWIDRSNLPDRPAPKPDFKVLVIGASMTGMAAAIKLRKVPKKNASACMPDRRTFRPAVRRGPELASRVSRCLRLNTTQ